ncbi:MAG: TIGR03960 family B12-binding radical SAM protein [Candidatus Gastranaerophilales bacterium]|nr:TIGR03960 family B12-binding radical SAM protein [Candidatus Gastranaerophilales bacterium]
MNIELPQDNQCLLYNVKKPYQYIGSEYLSYNKDFNLAEVKIAFAFPDKYEIAISNLGQKILYDIVNSDERFMADRVYAPDLDYREELIKNNLQLLTLESKKEVKAFDFVGFSLQYELAYPTVLEMLKLANIPVLRVERLENDPIIMAGGPCCFNPRPMQDFIDIFMVGDGEELLIEILETYKKLKSDGKLRTEIIKELSKLEGVFAPQEQNKTKKRIFDISKLNKAPKAPVPFSSSVHDRTIIEIRRGCGRMCRFCQAGHINLPIRERSAQSIIDMVKESVSITGYDEYSLLSLSSNDYKNIESVIEALSEEMNKKKVSVSLPSQRIDRYSTKLAKLVQGVRATTATLAPEAGSQRLRNVINKNLTEEQIIDTILNCYKNGSNHIKLYFMIGLPTETYEDLDEMAELFNKIRYRGKLLKKELELKDGLNLTCTVSIFVPKPFTPFQWFGQNSQEEVREKIKYLLDKVKTIKGLKINYHSSFTSKVESAMSRGNEKYNDFIFALHRKGAYLTTWDENIDKNLWEQTAIECGFNIDEDAQKAYSLDEELAWDIVDAGLDKEWLKEQYNNALKAANITPCEFNCVACGVCKNLKTHKVLDDEFEFVSQPSNEELKDRTVFRYRLKISKKDEMRYISHLDWQNTVVKTLYRSGLNLYFSQGFNPTPRFSLGVALPIFVEGENELIDIEIYDDIETNLLVEKLNAVLPQNIEVKSAEKINRTVGAIDIIAQWAQYVFEPIKQGLLQNEDLLYIKDKISSSNEIFIEKINKKGIKKLVNIKPSIKSVDVAEGKLCMILKTGQSDEIPSVKPDDVIKLFKPELNFKIIRTRFYDKDMSEL